MMPGTVDQLRDSESASLQLFISLGVRLFSSEKMQTVPFTVLLRAALLKKIRLTSNVLYERTLI